MRLLIDNTTRFFTVVGAPYIAERHYDVGSDLEPRGFPHTVHHTSAASQNGSTGWWLQDEC
jgi:hypothetical protein